MFTSIHTVMQSINVVHWVPLSYGFVPHLSKKSLLNFQSINVVIKSNVQEDNWVKLAVIISW